MDICTVLLLIGILSTQVLFQVWGLPEQIEDAGMVTTTHGKIRGFRAKVATGNEVDHYLGIPYAKPPIGNLRFKRSVFPDPWEDVYNATQLPNSCHQRPLNMLHLINVTFLDSLTPFNEDCLKINIWVPVPRKTLLPVMIWLHGGGNIYGSCSMPLYNGRILASEENVIVVCVNYRLMGFGFLHFDHPDYPGNCGNYDQLLAIQWMHQNAVNFGGDPEQITVFGESMGAAAAAHLLTTPLNKGYFKKAIFQSGVSNAIFGSTTEDFVIKASIDIAKNLDCDVYNMTSLGSCLRDAPPISVVEAMPIVQEIGMPLSAYPDGMLIQNNNATIRPENYSIIIGSNENEGSMIILVNFFGRLNLFADQNVLSFADFHRLVEKLLDDEDSEVREQVEKFYDEGGSNYYPATENLITDFVFVCPAEVLTEKMEKVGNTVYSYNFNYRSENSNYPKWFGVFHGAEVEYVLGFPLTEPSRYTDEDRQVSRRMMRYWANFARTGVPTATWSTHTPDQRNFLSIQSKEAVMGKGRRERFCNFLNNTLTSFKRQV